MKGDFELCVYYKIVTFRMADSAYFRIATALQVYLNTHGFQVAALIKFQVARGISPASGYLGPLTRAAFTNL